MCVGAVLAFPLRQQQLMLKALLCLLQRHFQMLYFLSATWKILNLLFSVNTLLFIADVYLTIVLRLKESAVYSVIL